MPNPQEPEDADPIEVAFALIPRFNMMALTAAMEPLRIANYLAPQPLYGWHFVSERGGRVQASNGLDIATEPVGNHCKPFHLVVACGSWGAEHYRSRELSRWLRLQRRAGARIASMDLGVYLLAEAGLLTGHAVTTHWSCLAGFAERFPDLDTREQLFTHDETVITISGGTAGIDLMLHLIAEKHGRQLASEIADQMLHHPIRDATLPQRHTLGGLTSQTHPQVRAAIRLMEANLAEPMSVPRLAKSIGTSQRQLERMFCRYMGCSAVRFNLLLRLQNARVLLTSTRLSVRDVSAACGFNTLSYFSHVFSRSFGKRPSEYRQAWPAGEVKPSWPGTVFDFREQARVKGLGQRRHERSARSGSPRWIRLSGS